MSAIEKVIRLHGSTVEVSGMGLQPRQDGTVSLFVSGSVEDDEGVKHELSGVLELKDGDKLVDMMLEMSAKALRQYNGLDDEPMSKEQKKK